MGLGRGCAALALSAAAGLSAATSAAQEPHPLARRAAELRAPATGSLAELRAAAARLVALLYEEPDAARSLSWREVVDDVCAGLAARGDDEACTSFAWEVAVGLRTGGDVRGARELLEGHLESRAPPDDDAYLPWIHVELADFARHAGDWTAARSHLDAARVLLVPGGADPFDSAPPADRVGALALATWCDVAGQLFLELGRTELAARAFDAHLALAEELDDDASWWAAVDNGVRLALTAGRLAEVEDLVERAREAAAWRRGRPEDRTKLALAVGRALVELERAGERDEGAAYEVLLGVVEEPAASGHDRFEAALFLATSALDQGAVEEAEEWLALARDQPAAGDDASRSAFGLAALGWRLARASGDPARLAAARADSRATLERFLASWSDAPLAPEGVGWLQSSWRSAFLAEVLALHGATLDDEAAGRAALADLLRVQARGTLTRALGAPVVSPDEVHALLGERRAALAYLPGRTASLALVVAGGRVARVELAPARALAAARRELVEAVRGVLLDRDAASEQRLASAVRAATARFLPPELWAALEPWPELVVVGADGAGVFGLECLATGDGTPLGLARAVGHVPSFPVAVALARAAAADAAPRAGVRLVAPAEAIRAPAGHAPLPPVPLDEAHVGRLLSLYGPARSATLVGPAADRAGLADLRLDDAAALVIVAHGLFDPTRPRPAGLLLANGDALWAADLEALAPPPVVALLACGAGRGPLRLGDDGKSHLGAALLVAGARLVVLGTVELEHRATLALDAAFHAELVAGTPPAEALRRARGAAIESGAGAAPPVHHLLVRAYGLGGAPLAVRTGGSPGAAWLVGAGLATAAVAALALRRRRH